MFLNVPNLRFSGFETNYQKAKIGKCLKIKSGQDQKNVCCDNGKYNIYGTGGIIGTTNSFLYDKESVGIGRKGTIDKPFYFDKPFWTVDTLFYSVINKGFSPKYIYYLFQTINWKKYNSSTGVPSLTSSTIESIDVRLASLEEQCKIAEFFTLIDARIDTQNKIIEKLESLKISIKEQIYLLGDRKEPLNKILFERVDKSKIQDQFPVLSSTVKGLFFQSDYFDRSVASNNNIGYKIVRKGQIILSPQNLWMGNITFNDKYDNGIVSPSYKIYDINTAYNNKYIYWLLTSKRSFFNYRLVSEQGASIVRRNLNVDSFMELQIPVVSDKKTENKIEQLICALEKKIDVEKRKAVLLVKQKECLLTNLFI